MLAKLKFLWSKTNRWHKGFFIFILLESKLLPGGQVGFTCNDPDLSYPFTGDTITWKTLLVTTIFLPLIVMLIVERKYHANEMAKPKKQALCWFKEYLYGFLINLIVIHSLKLAVGSPRPHFFDTCSPKEATTCVGTEYVHKYTCTKASWLNQSNRSFPSGHTTLALHTAFFIVYYLHKRSKCASRSHVILTVQILCVLTALYCSVSRMTDHRHHWWDVLAGALIVPPLLFYTVFHLCGDFECSISTTEELINDTNESNNKIREIIT